MIRGVGCKCSSSWCLLRTVSLGALTQREKKVIVLPTSQHGGCNMRVVNATDEGGGHWPGQHCRSHIAI